MTWTYKPDETTRCVECRWLPTRRNIVSEGHSWGDLPQSGNLCIWCLYRLPLREGQPFGGIGPAFRAENERNRGKR